MSRTLLGTGLRAVAALGSDAGSVTTISVVERHDWVNTFLGMLDASLHLTEEEQAPTLRILKDLFDGLDIPARGEPEVLPASVSLETDAGVYTRSMAGPRTSNLIRPIRAVTEFDEIVNVEVWVQAFLTMLVVAYPDLSAMEQMAARKTLAELLLALGVPDRAGHYYPAEVIQAYRDMH